LQRLHFNDVRSHCIIPQLLLVEFVALQEPMPRLRALKGKYGQMGTWLSILNQVPCLRAGNVSGNSAITWVASTSDLRALQKAAATDRIASTLVY